MGPQIGDHPFLTALSLFTIVAVLAVGFWQLRSVRRSQARMGEKPGETKIESRELDARLAAQGCTSDGGPMPSRAPATGGTGDETTQSAMPAEPIGDRR